ncbi:MAG: DUF2760 domain-containing protein [Gemmataceae bacterium]
MDFTNPGITVAVTVGVMIVLGLVVSLILTGGNFGRYWLAKRTALKVMMDQEFAATIRELIEPPPEPDTPPKPDGTPLRVLNLLQREGKLLDVLLEDLQGVEDVQIGQAFRDVQLKCQKALKEHLEFAAVIDAESDADVEVPAGFDPSAIQLTGNVTGEPPFKGTLIHPGWQVKEIKLSKPAEGVDELVVQPAEVEMP